MRHHIESKSWAEKLLVAVMVILSLSFAIWLLLNSTGAGNFFLRLTLLVVAAASHIYLYSTGENPWLVEGRRFRRKASSK